MRFIGNKENIIDKINDILVKNDVVGNSFFDFFSGTSNVAKYYKGKNFDVYSSDIMYFSFVLQRAFIENNTVPNFSKLLKKLNTTEKKLFSTPLDIIIDYLNNLEPIKGFIHDNYTPDGTQNLEIPRMYFTSENGSRIDSVRIKIETWYKEDLINKDEYYILLACLIESVPFHANIAGVYAAFHKKWDIRALKKFIIRDFGILVNNGKYKCYNSNSTELLEIVEADIFYLDPPYNHRQYAPNYHILETIAKYDNPQIYGVAGLRNYKEQKSKFCNKITAIEELNKIAEQGKFKYLVMSYNSEGVMSYDDIHNTLSKYGKVTFTDFEYLRYKSNSNGDSKSKKFIHEHLYILSK
jgi:adenine-specific DNA-methyltransferase